MQREQARCRMTHVARKVDGRPGRWLGLNARIAASGGVEMHPALGTRGLRRAVFATACAVCAQGCSTFFVHELRPQSTDELPICTESVAAPVADMVIAGTAFVF